MGDRYRKAVVSNDHDYGEYISQINFTRSARKGVEQEKLYNKVLELFLNEYPEESSGKRQCKLKARKIAGYDSGEPQNFIPKFEGSEGSERAVKEAIEKGYLIDVKLDVPWHPAIFNNENKLTTFPHQHKYAVLYTGRRGFEFFSKKYCKKQEVHKNVLVEGEELSSAEELINLESTLKE